MTCLNLICFVLFWCSTSHCVPIVSAERENYNWPKLVTQNCPCLRIVPTENILNLNILVTICIVHMKTPSRLAERFFCHSQFETLEKSQSDQGAISKLRPLLLPLPVSQWNKDLWCNLFPLTTDSVQKLTTNWVMVKLDHCDLMADH